MAGKARRPVKRGDVVAVVETQKGAIEIEIFNNGVVSELAVPVGQRVPVGTVLASADGEAVAAPAIPPPTPAPPALTPAAIPSPTRRLRQVACRYHPAARRRAAERGVDLQRIKGTGPGGAITIADVERQQRTAPAERLRRRRCFAAPGFDPAAMRQAIAAAMSRSKREIPHYYLSQTIDLARRSHGWRS